MPSPNCPKLRACLAFRGLKIDACCLLYATSLQLPVQHWVTSDNRQHTYNDNTHAGSRTVYTFRIEYSLKMSYTLSTIWAFEFLFSRNNYLGVKPLTSSSFSFLFSGFLMNLQDLSSDSYSYCLRMDQAKTSCDLKVSSNIGQTGLIMMD